MAHDYAKKPRANAKTAPKAKAARTTKRARRAPEPPAKSIPGWLWLLVGLAMGAFVMFLVRLADVDTAESTAAPTPVVAPAVKAAPEKTTRTAPAKTAANPQKPAPKAEPQKPRFDFYHMLKENEVPVAAPSGDTAQAKAKPERIFILQVASFKKPEDAEQLKVELLLLNLEARTEEVKVRNGETWHRVLTGPFKTRSQLAKARSTLISNGHQALVMEYKGPK